MANISIRGLDDDLMELLRARAARGGRSVEAEVRQILTEESNREPEPDAAAAQARFERAVRPFLEKNPAAAKQYRKWRGAGRGRPAA